MAIQTPAGGRRRFVRTTPRRACGRLVMPAVAAIGLLLGTLSSARAYVDPELLWIAAGAHGAPCDYTGRCAKNLGCDPDSLSCLNPARLQLSVINTQLCSWDDSTAIDFEATNVGEIWADENVEIDATVRAQYVDAVCSPDGPGTFHGSWWEIFNQYAQTRSWPHVSVPVQLAPGERTELRAELARWLPPYTYIVDIDTTLTSPSGGFASNYIHKVIPKDPFTDLDEDCAPSDLICN